MHFNILLSYFMKRSFSFLFKSSSCIFLFLALLSCASKQIANDLVFNSRPFLKEYKRYALTAGIGNPALNAVIDAEGKWIYYSRENAGNTDIFAVDSYSLETYRLTRSPAIDSFVSIDSKSKNIVFSSTRDDAFGDIYLLKLVNYGIRKSENSLDTLEQDIVKLTSYKGYDAEPVISHNSDLIAFVSDRTYGRRLLYTMKTSGKDIIKRSDIEAKNPSFSFDDKFVVFINAKDGENVSQLALLDLSKGNDTNTLILTDTKTFKFNPVFYNDDTIIFFEIIKDTDEDGSITYLDKRRLMSYSISTGNTYILDPDTELTTFNVAYPSALVGAYINQLEGTSIVSMGSTKEYFIKDNDISTMYKTFLELPYVRKIDVVDRLFEYFPFTNDSADIAKAYFNLMCEAYTNKDGGIYDGAKYILMNNYSNTISGMATIEMDNAINGVNSDFILTNHNTNEIAVWTGYIAADELFKRYNNKNIGEIVNILTNIIVIPSDKSLYMLIAKLYNKTLELDGYSYTNELYNMSFRRNDLTFSDKLYIAKDFIKDTKFLYDSIIEAYPIDNFFSVAARLSLIDGLMASKDYDTVTNLFEPYVNSRNGGFRALGFYAYGKMKLEAKDESAYVSFQEALKTGGNDFLYTEEENESKMILASYYRNVSDNAYQNSKYSIAYENYRQVLIYNPNDSTSATRVMESGLRSFSDIGSLEETIFRREKTILKTRYSDHSAHAELASTYYYLANRYYNLALEKQSSKNRYIVSDKKREDGFYFYLNKSFNAIVKNALSYIDFAIFLYPNNQDYYLKKAEMLSFAQALKMQVILEDKTYKSIMELVPAYNDNTYTNNRFAGYNTLAFQTSDLDSKMINALVEAKNRTKNSPNIISLMLANAYLINGRYLDAAKEYAEVLAVMDKSENEKTRAWYHFFYGYSLWMNNDVSNAYREYETAKKLFKELGDKETVYRIVGYTAIAAIEQKDYNKAVSYLMERASLIIQNNEKDDLNDLLLAACYLKMEDYNNALIYCDKVKNEIDKLDSSTYTPRYVSLTFFGANVNIINLGLAAFGGYIPGEPLNVDKQQMLYSIYQDLYEKIGRYSDAREALFSYRNYIVKDKPKQSIQPLMLATYYNNEGYLYYRQGEVSNAIMSFRTSITEYKKTLDIKTIEQNPSIIYQNAVNDAKNYLSLSSLYLRYLSQTDLKSIKKEFFIELYNTSKALQALSTNMSVSPKDRLLLYSHIAASEYILAFKATSDLTTSSSRYKKEDPTDMTFHDVNIQRLRLLKNAIDKYNYILSPKSYLPVDLKTEIIVRYNLAKSYELAGYIEEAAREYVAAYSKAKVSEFAIEEIAILTTMIDFSQKYRDKYPESIDYPMQYVIRILQRLRESVFMITFVENNNLVLREAKYSLLNFFGSSYPDASVNVLAMFDALEMRRKFLDERLYTLGRNNYYLSEYYKLYEKALFSYQKYLDSVTSVYNAAGEKAALKEIYNYEKEARDKFANTPIASIAIGDVKVANLDLAMRKDETLIWDSISNFRFITENGKTSFYFQNDELPLTKPYVTHIGENPILITNNNVFVREVLDSTLYLLPPKTSLVENGLYSALRVSKEYESNNSNFIILTNNKTNYTTNYFQNFKFIDFNTLSTNAYSPLVVDLSYANANDITKILSKRLYIVYVSRDTFDSYKDLIKTLDPIALIVGNSNQISRDVFYSNYLSKLKNNTIEEAMYGFDKTLFTMYGKPDNSMSVLSNSVLSYKDVVLNAYKKNPTRNNMSNVIRYSQSYDETIGHYRMFIDDASSKKDTNTAYIMSEEGFKFFNSSYSNISETNAYLFMKSMLPIYRRLGDEGAIKSANRTLFYVTKYANSGDDLINEYFTPFTLSRFLKTQKNTDMAMKYLDFIVPYIVGSNKNKINEIAILYDIIYAKAATNKVESFLSNITNASEILTVANTILSKPSDLTNESDTFYTMNYVYANQFIFDASTVSSFADIFYSLYKTNASYIFGLLNKTRFPESDFIENIKNVYKVFSSEDTNTMFIFYAYENSRYSAYSYVVGDSEVKKSYLSSAQKVSELMTYFTNAKNENDRIKSLEWLEKEIVSKQISDDIKKADRVYITGSYSSSFMIPFAYMKSFLNKDVIKVREMKYASSDITKLQKPSIVSFRDSNFYTDLEYLAVDSSYLTNNYSKKGFIHYIGANTNVKPFENNDIFLSPITFRDAFGYLKEHSESKLLFTYCYDNAGDYFTTMKNLYLGFDKGIIDSYRNIRKENKDKTIPLKTEDGNILYKASYTLFDYILPYIPN